MKKKIVLLIALLAITSNVNALSYIKAENNLCTETENYKKWKYKKFNKVKEFNIPKIKAINTDIKNVVIVGAGPSGLFSALTLVQNGISPIVIEQGESVENRKISVDKFLKNGNLNVLSNVQFGEGGAGTFSDGKLTTGINSPYCKKVLQEFVNFGAPEQILYLSKPHIGTDNLRNVVKNIREYIISKGGQVLFNEKVTNFEIEEGKIKAVKCSKRIETDSVILAIGHSARDTFKKLYDLGVEIQPKNFAVGVRIEHLQENINIAQYGENPSLKGLPVADYKLIYHAKNGRTCYTFCMCPGGQVMASNSEENSIVTNGMSNFSRDGKNANSALLVNVMVADYYRNSPLDGMYFQEELEKKAFDLGGKNYNAPAQKVEDFLEDKETTEFGNVRPTYMPGVTGANLNKILPQFVSNTMKEAIVELDKKLHGFANNDAVLTGVETRSSSPVQITRDKTDLNSANVQGLYPCGEGAGYAGGITTSAMDGLKVAESIISTYQNL